MGANIGRFSKKMENDKEDHRLERNVYYEYMKNNNKMREYHVDYHPFFRDESYNVSKMPTK